MRGGLPGRGQMGSGVFRVLAAVTALAVTSIPALAADAPLVPYEQETWSLKDRLFFFAGTDIANDSRFAWAGIGGALLGRLEEDGPRFRFMGGAGRYRYRTGAVPGGINRGNVTSGEFMLGFRRTIGAVAVTGYLGAHVEDQRLVSPDPGHQAVGTAFGVKAALEFFTRLGLDWVVSGSAAVSTVHRGYHARIAFAREPPPGIAVGVEASVHGDARYIEPRAGLFAQRTFGRTVFALSGGYLSNSDKGKGAYGTLAVYAPY